VPPRGCSDLFPKGFPCPERVDWWWADPAAGLLMVPIGLKRARWAAVVILRELRS